MFYVGQKVVCAGVGDNKSNLTKDQIDHWKINLPVVKSVYTIGSIFVSNDKECLRLIELDNRHVKTTTGVEIGFRSFMFRPVVERKTDISIFKAMLNPSEQRADA